MNPEANDFETLRRLIALKRHEQPPPGYFSRLPDRIWARLERGEGQPGFWEHWLARLAFRPAFVYGFSLAALSALTVSVVYSVRTQPEDSARKSPSDGWRTGMLDAASAIDYNPAQPMHVPNWSGEDTASNPAPVMPSLFPSSIHPSAVPVSFASPP
jgi:hypothetical protein